MHVFLGYLQVVSKDIQTKLCTFFHLTTTSSNHSLRTHQIDQSSTNSTWHKWSNLRLVLGNMRKQCQLSYVIFKKQFQNIGLRLGSCRNKAPTAEWSQHQALWLNTRFQSTWNPIVAPLSFFETNRITCLWPEKLWRSPKFPISSIFEATCLFNLSLSELDIPWVHHKDTVKNTRKQLGRGRTYGLMSSTGVPSNKSRPRTTTGRGGKFPWEVSYTECTSH